MNEIKRQPNSGNHFWKKILLWFLYFSWFWFLEPLMQILRYVLTAAGRESGAWIGKFCANFYTDRPNFVRKCHFLKHKGFKLMISISEKFPKTFIFDQNSLFTPFSVDESGRKVHESLPAIFLGRYASKRTIFRQCSQFTT